jgi:multidrug efflux pump subunit AcrB
VKKAQAIEKHRNDRNSAKQSYEFASGALELGILLASTSIVTSFIPLAFIGGGIGVIGAVMGLCGWFAPHLLG